jgi:hypothetical protein
MFIPVHNALGYLESGVLSISNVLPVDPTLYAALVAALGVGGTDHTYLALGESPTMEVVKVIEMSGGMAEVNRGEDGTTPIAYAANTPIRYLFTAAAARDIVQEQLPVNISLQGISPIVVTEITTNEFEVSLLPLALQSDDNSVLVVGAWPNISLAVNKANAGCCT